MALTVSWAHAQEDAEEPEPKNDLGLFVGSLTNLEADESGPGIGLDYTREFTEKLGVVVLAEWANAGEREAMFGGGVEIKPGANIKLVFAPAVVIEKEDDSTSGVFAFRTGIGYMFEVSHVPLTPIAYFDIVDSEDGVDAHFVIGLTVDIPF